MVVQGIPRFIEIGGKISIFGLTVHPEDLLHGDKNGLVSIPIDIAAQVSVEVEKVRKRESELVTYIQSDEFTLEGMFERFAFW